MAPSTSELLALGVQHHQRGALREAEQLYRQVLQAEPQNAEGLFYQGVLHYQLGQPQLAFENLTRAIALRPGVAAFHCYLGLVYWALGRPQEAVAAYQQAVSFDPNYADAHNNLGVALQRLGRMAEAMPCFEAAVRCNPNFAEACSNLGAVYQDQGRMAEAIANFHHAVRCKPDFAAAYNNLGVLYLGEGDAEEAVANSSKAVQLQPDYPEAHYNLGLAYKRLERFDQAVASFHQALHYRPDYADAYNDLGLALQAWGKLKESLTAFGEAIRLRPDFADAHLGRASTLLLAGDFAEGWPEYEWRWRCAGFVAPPLRLPRPAWDGSPLHGRTLLVRSEQGLGDTLQFIRYAAIVQERGGRIVLETQPKLIPLLRSCPGIDQVFALEDAPPAHDLHCYLLSLPRLLGATLENVPARVPYVKADPVLVDRWRCELQGLSGFKVGICWQGNPAHKQDRLRSFPLHAFGPLAELEGVHLISLQTGPGTESLLQKGSDPFSVMDLGNRFDPDSLSDAAAAILNLDLVITTDTGLAHLAGALGAPVWLLLAYSPDWRWLREREDSPWYPTMRLFRQARPGDWKGVFLKVREALQDLLATDRHKSNVQDVQLLPSPPVLRGRGAGGEGDATSSAPSPPAPLPLSTGGEGSKAETLNTSALTRRTGAAEPAGALPQEPTPQAIPQPVSPETPCYDPYNLMAAALLAQGKLEEAAACWQQGLAMNPRSHDMHNNLGVCLSRLGEKEQAREHFEQALRLKPNFAEGLTNLGEVLGDQGKLEEALAYFEKALCLKPDLAETHLARAQTLLLAGNFAEGWPAFEWRRHCADFGAAFYAACPQPSWDGSSLAGRTILLRAEQGLGDTFQFIRFAPLVKARGGRVLVEAQAPLLPLLSTCQGIDQLFAQGELPPRFDVQALLLSLPRLLGTDLNNFPAQVPYVSAEPTRVTRFQEILSSRPGYKVGVCWQGNARNRNDRNRSVPLPRLAALAEVPGVCLVSLQRDMESDVWTPLPEDWPAVTLPAPPTDLGQSWLETAALIRAVDLVVTVDTAIAHLAGALGVPVWVALAFGPDWRWLQAREDSPWYPSMRLFRQSRRGDWVEVFERIRDAIWERLAQETPAGLPGR